MENKPIAIAYQLLQKDLTLTLAQGKNALLGEKEILSMLEKELKELLNHNFEKLCNTMYRLDIDEKKFDAIITYTTPGEIAQQLSLLIWERELTKAKYRMRYTQDN